MTEDHGAVVTLVVVGGIALVLGLWAIWGLWHDTIFDGLRGRVFLTLLICAVAGLFGCLAAAGAGAAIGAMADESIQRPAGHVAPLVSLRSADGIHGTLSGGMFVFSGMVGTEQYYFWYEQDGAAVVPRKVRAGQGVYIFETDRKDAEVRVFDWFFTHPWVSWFGFKDFGKTWEFHVPTGTVQKQISVQ